MQDSKPINTKSVIKEALAAILGIEPEDIHDDDSFETDLHMDASVLADLTHNLQLKGLDTQNLDFTEIETVDDLIELLGNN